MEFERAIRALSAAGVEFVLVGGVAATLHGSASVTYDLDICYARTRLNLLRLASTLAPFRPRPRGCPVDQPFSWDWTTLATSTLLTLRTDLGDINLLGEVAGVGSHDDVRGAAVEVEAFGRRVWTMDLPGLIRAKRAAGRLKDLSIIPELESLLEAGER